MENSFISPVLSFITKLLDSKKHTNHQSTRVLKLKMLILNKTMYLRLLLSVFFTITLFSCDNRFVFLKKNVTAYITEIHVERISTKEEKPNFNFSIKTDDGYMVCSKSASETIKLDIANNYSAVFKTDCQVPNNNYAYYIYFYSTNEFENEIGKPFRIKIQELLDQKIKRRKDKLPSTYEYFNNHFRVNLKFRWEDYSGTPVE